MPPRRKTLEEYFWARVKKTATCWLWTGRTMHFGYGVIQLYQRAPHISSHRASWMIHHGSIPNGLWVLHKCDVPACVNPDHLFLGTHADNMKDAQRKGRLSVPGKGWLGKRTHCPRGHEFNEKNTYVYRTGKKVVRLCRPCRKENQRQYMERRQ